MVLLVEDNEDDIHYSPAHYLPAPAGEEPAQLCSLKDIYAMRTHALQAALANLDERSVDIIRHRWLDDGKTSLKELAEKYGVSLERIRQIEKAAMTKLREALTDLA